MLLVLFMLPKQDWPDSYETPEGVLWYLAPNDISSRSFKSCRLRGEATVYWTCWSSTSHRCSIRLRSEEFGGQSNACSSKHSWTMCAVFQGPLSCWKRTLTVHHGTPVSWRVCAGMLACVKLTSTWMAGPRVFQENIA